MSLIGEEKRRAFNLEVHNLQDLRISHKKVRRIMAEMGIQVIYARPRTIQFLYPEEMRLTNLLGLAFKIEHNERPNSRT